MTVDARQLGQLRTRMFPRRAAPVSLMTDDVIFTLGCHFSPRCPKAFDRCFRETPQSRLVGENHRAACHLY